MIAIAGGNSIRCAPYALFGSEQLAKAAVTAMDERYACLLANHGQLTGANSLTEALNLAIEVEQLSASYHACLTLGNVQILSEGDMHSVLKKFSSYGQQDV
jgi:L-fuculose-phosphate aldolase